MPSRMLSIGYGRPITPVEPITSSSGRTPAFAAAMRRTSSACAAPTLPVATLALRATTTMPRLRCAAVSARLSSTLGPAKRDLVYTAAETAGTSETTTAKSWAVSFSPMFAVYERNPCGTAWSMAAPLSMHTDTLINIHPQSGGRHGFTEGIHRKRRNSCSRQVG